MGSKTEEISFPDHDPLREYTPEEARILTGHLLDLTESVHAGRLSTVSLAQLYELHRRLFEGVRKHAGRPRSHDFGSERLRFGPNRSVHRSEVAEELRGVFAALERSLQSFAGNEDSLNYERSALRLAVWAHAEVIRIHPFEDGNGRTSRLLMTQILVKLGLRPIPLEATKEEYTEALNDYFDDKDMKRLLDLFVRLYPVPEPE